MTTTSATSTPSASQVHTDAARRALAWSYWEAIRRLSGRRGNAAYNRASRHSERSKSALGQTEYRLETMDHEGVTTLTLIPPADQSGWPTPQVGDLAYAEATEGEVTVIYHPNGQFTIAHRRPTTARPSAIPGSFDVASAEGCRTPNQMVDVAIWLLHTKETQPTSYKYHPTTVADSSQILEQEGVAALDFVPNSPAKPVSTSPSRFSRKSKSRSKPHSGCGTM